MSIIGHGDSNEQMFEAENPSRTKFLEVLEIEAENLTQMEFPEVKFKDKVELQNDEENGVNFEVFALVLRS